MKKNNLWYLSAVLLTVLGSTTLAMTTPLKPVKAQVAPRMGATAPATLPKSILAQATSPAWPKISLIKRFSGLSQPVHITNAGDGSGRLFVVEQSGRIRVIDKTAFY